jgi:hypothetical protein
VDGSAGVWIKKGLFDLFDAHTQLLEQIIRIVVLTGLGGAQGVAICGTNSL